MPNGGPLHLPSTFVSALGPRGLLARMRDVPRDVPAHRLPLHAACANALSPDAGLMVRELLQSYRRGAAVRDLEARPRPGSAAPHAAPTPLGECVQLAFAS